MTLLHAVALRGDLCAVADEVRPEAATALNLLVAFEQESDWKAVVSWALIRMRDDKHWLVSPFYEGGKVKAAESSAWMVANKPGLNPNQRVWKVTPAGQAELDRQDLGKGWPTADIGEAIAEADQEGAFEQHSWADARRRTLRLIAIRQGQPKFRQELIQAYKRCLVSGCDAVEALEAAHIRPYASRGTNSVSNGLLMRADLHTLFDLHLMRIDPDKLVVRVHPTLMRTTYQEFHGQPLAFPPGTETRPDPIALKERWMLTGPF